MSWFDDSPSIPSPIPPSSSPVEHTTHQSRHSTAQHNTEIARHGMACIHAPSVLTGVTHYRRLLRPRHSCRLAIIDAHTTGGCDPNLHHHVRQHLPLAATSRTQRICICTQIWDVLRRPPLASHASSVVIGQPSTRNPLARRMSTPTLLTNRQPLFLL